MPGFLRCLAVAIFLVWGSAPTAAAEPFRQDRFALGLWVPPQTKENLEFRYRELAEANFNLVIGNSPVPVTEQLRVCDHLGLKTLVHAPGAVETWPTNASCWGYLLRDEPSLADFAGLAQSVADIRRLRPGRLGYVNLFPNYANAGQLGATNYEEHVARFLADVKPEVLSMDHYPLMRPTADRRDAYCENLETFRRHSVAAGVPFWNFFHAMPFADRMDPTEAQIRWQIYAAAAYGAKGVLYFCYWTPGQGNAGTGEFPKGGALLTAEGRRTRHYDEAKRINAELKNLGPTLMQLIGEGVRRVHTSREPARGLTNSPVRNLQPVKGDPHAEFLVGSLRHADGRRAVLLVNHDHAYTAWPTVTFDAAPDTVREVDKATGAEVPLPDDSPELPGVQLSFGAGDGRLFLLPAAR